MKKYKTEILKAVATIAEFVESLNEEDAVYFGKHGLMKPILSQLKDLASICQVYKNTDKSSKCFNVDPGMRDDNHLW